MSSRHRLAAATALKDHRSLSGSQEISVHGMEAVCDPLGALYLPQSRTLIVSDLHLEKGSAFARRGMMLPPYDTLATLKILSGVIARYAPQRIISLGDNFHDRIGSQYLSADLRALIVSLGSGREWIWINGNHDPDGAFGLPGISLDELTDGSLVFRHKPRPYSGAAMVGGEISGHLHPSATVRRLAKSIRRPCFASDGHRLIMPAFGVLSGGLDLRHKAMNGMFELPTLVAHIMGRDRIYSVRYANLAG